MENKSLIVDNQLSWIRDTSISVSDGKTAEQQADKPPVRHEGKPHRENAGTSAAQPSTPTRPDIRQQNHVRPDMQHAVKPSPRQPSMHNARPDQQARPLTSASGAIGLEMRQAGRPIPQQPPDILEHRTALREPSKLHYWLSIVAMIIVAVSPVPDRYAIMIFLGFIFVLLMDISYRFRQQHYVNTVNAENTSQILRLLKEERGDDSLSSISRVG